MAQDPDRQDETENQDGILTSHALDMVTLFQSSTVDAEMEADMIRGILDSNGIPAIVSDTPYSGILGTEVKVPRGRLKEAQSLIAEAQAAGPEAAAEAEAASEEK
jgi:Putative prokaryotic signal transducing protein